MRYFCTHCAQFVDEYIPESTGWFDQPGRSEGVLNVSCKSCGSQNSSPGAPSPETAEPDSRILSTEDYARIKATVDKRMEALHLRDAEFAQKMEQVREAEAVAERAQQARFGKAIALIGGSAAVLALIYFVATR